MTSSLSEMAKTRLLPSVVKVALSPDLVNVVVTLRKADMQGKNRRHFLFFSAATFTSAQVQQALDKLDQSTGHTTTIPTNA